MSEAEPVSTAFERALGQAAASSEPFRFWQLQQVLPAHAVQALRAISPIAPQQIDTKGRRETHNALRRFFDPGLQAANAEVAEMASYLQSPAAIAAIYALTGTDLSGNFLRIEYCQDVSGFWLEPHTDIGAKKFTMLIYLSDPPMGECWGTDLLYPDGSLALRARGEANSAVIFIPGEDSWHGFAPRPISGVRRTLIVNYVVPEWRARHELCFAGRPVARLEAAGA